MYTKLTLRMDEALVQKAKMEAKRQGKSVSRMAAEFIESLGSRPGSEKPLPPTTASLVGILKRQEVSEDELVGRLYFHMGDESWFRAKKK